MDGRRIEMIHCVETGSTNADAKGLLRGGKGAPFCIYADRQTAGVGRFGRVFHSPIGGVYMTLVLNERDFCYKFATGLVAVCIVRVIKRYLSNERARGLRVKWVNDIFLDGKKCGGILVEKVGSWFVIGIGINLKKTADVSPEYKDVIGFLDLDVANEVFVRDIVAEIVGCKLNDEEVREQYLRNCDIVGKFYDSGAHQGEVEALEIDGSIIVGSVRIVAG